MANRFIGREQELKELRQLFEKNSASLVVVTGRRRIGKSCLIQEFAKPYAFYAFTGTPPMPSMTIDEQLFFFSEQFRLQAGLLELKTSSWLELFHLLAQQVKDEGRVVILFDEISWMGSQDPYFLGQLKDAWDLYFSKNPNLILVLCGSVSSWIENNILSGSAFMGRVSHQLTLEELPLNKCNEFWSESPYTSAYDKLKVLSITGGVPRYLKELNLQLPAEENIQRMCFKKDGMLVKEFDHIFTDLFSRRKHSFKRIVEVLASGSKELHEICDELKIKQSGYISECLDILVKSGFVRRDYTWSIQTGKRSRLSLFRLSDNYLRFYLKYIDPVLSAIQQNSYKDKPLTSLKNWSTIMGLQFENLVLNNKTFIYESLEIKPATIVSSDPYFQRATNAQDGCQIDLLIQTELNALYVCEVKFSKYQLGKEVIEQVKRKIERLKVPRGFSLIPVLIHVNGVQDEVEDAGYFKRIIDFTRVFS
jgi:AAA+ ATPase superfamily predicted ATPase